MPTKKFSFYKLVDGTIEIDGIRMHQTLKKTPLQDAKDKVKLLKIRNGYKVLDICTGLGYTAIEESKKASFVITIDNDWNVIEKAKENIDSIDLFSSPNIQIVLGDAEEIIKTFPDNFFDAIMHDPPRFSRAGHLYSFKFYSELYRILKKRKLLFHYTGKPGEKRGLKFTKGVKKRLKEAGFSSIIWIDDCLGFLCRK